jgi:hypothetical protein
LFTNVSNNYDYAAIRSAASSASVALVFVNADSGEGYITVDGNAGDRNNLTLWQNGDELIRQVASVNPNTIVTIHSVGAVIVEEIKNNPNVTAILWAGLPGQESGNAITDILYGVRNPSAKSPFTWGKKREDWGTDVVYSFPTNPGQLNFAEGTFIDYRHFDYAGIEPSYEFGYGLSYTNYTYSNLQIVKNDPGPYQPTTGFTKPAPTLGTIDHSVADNSFPAGFRKVFDYIYPYLSGPVPTGNASSWPAGYNDSSPQPKIGSGGSAGGNRQLWDTMYTVSATVTNTGSVKGTEIAQLVSSALLC